MSYRTLENTTRGVREAAMCEAAGVKRVVNPDGSVSYKAKNKVGVERTFHDMTAVASYMAEGGDADTPKTGVEGDAEALAAKSPDARLNRKKQFMTKVIDEGDRQMADKGKTVSEEMTDSKKTKVYGSAEKARECIGKIHDCLYSIDNRIGRRGTNVSNKKEIDGHHKALVGHVADMKRHIEAHYVTDEDQGRTPGQTAGMHESATLSELRKETLTSYIKKSSKSAANHALAHGRAAATGDQAKAAASSSKMSKRLSGVSLAAGKLGETVGFEPGKMSLTELSKRTLGNYAKKATRDLKYSAGEAGRADDAGESKAAAARANKRERGVGQAVNRLLSK